MTRTLKIAGNSAPFEDDASYIQAELDWLAVRVSRILAERQSRDALAEETEGDPAHLYRPGRVASREVRCRAVEFREAEKKLRDTLDARLRLHREQRDVPTMGLDLVCRDAGLSAEERLVLLVALPYGLSQALAESTLKDLAHHWGAISVSDCVAVLDPRNVADLLHYRRLFRTSGALVSHGLIQICKHSGEASPSTLLSGDVSLSLDCFARLTGDGEAATEGD